NNAAWFLARHAMFLGAALAAALMVFLVPARWWQRAAPWLFLGGVALLAVVLIPGVGREVNGARRWLPLPVFSVQPSELMKLAASSCWCSPRPIACTASSATWIPGPIPSAAAISCPTP